MPVRIAWEGVAMRFVEQRLEAQLENCRVRRNSLALPS
jgi:hypothetical protein